MKTEESNIIIYLRFRELGVLNNNFKGQIVILSRPVFEY